MKVPQKIKFLLNFLKVAIIYGHPVQISDLLADLFCIFAGSVVSNYIILC